MSMEYRDGNIPHMLDYWAIRGVHLLKLKSSLDDLYPPRYYSQHIHLHLAERESVPIVEV